MRAACATWSVKKGTSVAQSRKRGDVDKILGQITQHFFKVEDYRTSLLIAHCRSQVERVLAPFRAFALSSNSPQPTV